MRVISQKLEESEAFNKKVLSTLSSRIAVVDNQGKIEFVNSAWENFTFKSRFERVNNTSIGDNCFEFFGEAISLGDYIAKIALNGIKSVLSGERETFQTEYEFEFCEKKQFLCCLYLY